MKTRVNLTVEEDVVAYAKQYAQEHGTSVSELVENYLVTLNTASTSIPKRSILELIEGLPKPKEDYSGKDFKKLYWEAMEKKYKK